MSWWTLLVAVALMVAVVVLGRLGPSEGRPAGRTKLMKAARWVFAAMALLLLLATLFAPT